MKQVTNRAKLDIRGAVEMGTAMIHSGVISFFLDTEFGRIPVEVWKEKYTMYGSETYEWSSAPFTEFTKRNRKTDCKWYVKILKTQNQSQEITKMQLIREFSAIMFASISGYLPAEEDMISLTLAYLDTYSTFVDDVKLRESFGRDYVRLTTGVQGALNSAVRQTIWSEVCRTMRTEDIVYRKVRIEANERLRESGLSTNAFFDDFHNLLAGLAMRETAKKTEAYKAIMEEEGEISAYMLIKRVFTFKRKIKEEK